MLKSIRPLTFLLCLSLGTGLGFAPAARALNYCADMVMTSSGHTAVPVMKTCVKGKKIRRELNQGGMHMIIIYRPDKKVTWTLMPMMKSYMEMTYKEGEQEPQENWQENYDSLKKHGKLMGTETVNGVLCEKFVLGKQGKDLTYWISKKDKLPIRIISGETTINYNNLQTDNIPDSLFEIPAGYHKMNIPNMPAGGGMSHGMMPPGAGR